MWHALRTELAYFRPWLFGGLGIAAGVTVIISAVFLLVDDGPPTFAAAGLRGFFIMMAPMIVGFIVQSYRYEERRSRLLLAGTFTPVKLAGLMMLLPAGLFLIGVLAAGLVIGGEFLVTGRLALETLRMVGYVGGLMFMMMLMGLLAQEATAAHRQRRRLAAAAGWAGFVVAVLLLAALSSVAVLGFLTWTHLNLSNLIVAVAAGVATVALYAGRTDFTR